MNVNGTPIPVKRALKKLGQDLRDARRRRRLPMQLSAERAGISRATLGKVERGDEGVSVGAYIRVIFTLGMIDRLSQLIDSKFDRLGMELEVEHLPQRVRMKKSRG
jgi:transcriptional regulator with XRE-family HTH domain